MLEAVFYSQLYVVEVNDNVTSIVCRVVNVPLEHIGKDLLFSGHTILQGPILTLLTRFCLALEDSFSIFEVMYPIIFEACHLLWILRLLSFTRPCTH